MHGGAGVIDSSLRANGSRGCAPDDGLREAIHGAVSAEWIASSLTLLAMTAVSESRYTASGCHRGVYPNFSCSNGHNRSGLNGTAVKRMPVASASALPSAAATGL